MILLLTMVQEGLAVGFAGVHDLSQLRALLRLPYEVIPLGILPIGHRAPNNSRLVFSADGKPIADAVHREGWQKMPPNEGGWPTRSSALPDDAGGLVC